MPTAEDTRKWSFKADRDGVQWVCRGNHHRSADCEWELAAEVNDAMSFLSTSNTEIKNIDLYDTPIDQRPLPRRDTVAYCIEYLRDHGDHYGVRLLESMRDEENAENSQCPREETGC